MPRVVVTKNFADAAEGATNCPMQAFRKGPNGELVIDPSVCIDCGVCQSVTPEGAILEDSEAPAEATKFNEENAEKWEMA